MADTPKETAERPKTAEAPHRFGTAPVTKSDNEAALACQAKGLAGAVDTLKTHVGDCSIDLGPGHSGGTRTIDGKDGQVSKITTVSPDHQTTTLTRDGNSNQWTMSQESPGAPKQEMKVSNVKLSDGGKTVDFDDGNMHIKESPGRMSASQNGQLQEVMITDPSGVDRDFQRKGNSWTMTAHKDGYKDSVSPVSDVKLSDDGKTLEWTNKNGTRSTETPDTLKNDVQNNPTTKAQVLDKDGTSNIPTDAMKEKGFLATRFRNDNGIDVGSLVDGNGPGMHINADGTGFIYFDGKRSEVSRKLTDTEMNSIRKYGYMGLMANYENGQVKLNDGVPEITPQFPPGTNSK